ncbi:MotA/TolQ/ExbB proton channel family protein [Jannaschia aquimarina]|uniref:ExbB_1 protein n=1 Tax=Jannaschia aquimarina TaxID=935700 RepID=A0A0D1EKM7_9RHOB|nr:MotA/TolQ/ExbB proton channel family protein [Jannaschia aquimarina]KIT17566.1 Biopolymer transport protein ExbB [Jannaschia aquimarina]SNS72685.1 outer membrane transport energization protein ExbB [Jannaschia aquimarina]
MSGPTDRVADLLALGGPVVMLLLAMSVVALAVTFYKLWQFRAARVGTHTRLQEVLEAWDLGDERVARSRLAESRSHLAPLAGLALKARDDEALRDRLDAEGAMSFAKLERGFRILDNIAQLAPLLGLFGTVLGMIDAFRALQAAGAAVDPSILAGGIWVALLTTAVGLAVAMPTSLVLSWLESRVDRERDFADLLIARARSPLAPVATTPAGVVHA